MQLAITNCTQRFQELVCHSVSNNSQWAYEQMVPAGMFVCFPTTICQCNLFLMGPRCCPFEVPFYITPSIQYLIFNLVGWKENNFVGEVNQIVSVLERAFLGVKVLSFAIQKKWAQKFHLQYKEHGLVSVELKQIFSMHDFKISTRNIPQTCFALESSRNFD